MIRAGRAEGLLCDDLAVLSIKAGKGCAISAAEYTRLREDIERGVGIGVCYAVLGSVEMESLTEINRTLFDLIDELKTRPPALDDALRVDLLNLARNRAKAAIHARWFPTSTFTEVKLGYDRPPVDTTSAPYSIP